MGCLRLRRGKLGSLVKTRRVSRGCCTTRYTELHPRQGVASYHSSGVSRNTRRGVYRLLLDKRQTRRLE